MISLTSRDLYQVARKLEMKIREKKHTNASLEYLGKVVVTTAWSHGGKEIHRGLATRILKNQLLLDTPQQARDLVNCPMGLPDYLDHLKNIGKIPR